MQTKWQVEFEDGSKEVLTIEQTRATFNHVSAALNDAARKQNKGKIVDFEMLNFSEISLSD